nr:hypothetical protein [Actinomycetales bacterium]
MDAMWEAADELERELAKGRTRPIGDSGLTHEEAESWVTGGRHERERGR